MSIEAMLWAFKQNPERSAAKLVLLELSNHAGTDNTAWPSLARICSQTNLDRKTVISALDSLEDKGLIADTRERKGSSSQIKVYKLNLQRTLNERVPETEQSQETVPVIPETVPIFPRDSTKNGTRNLLLNHKESNSTSITPRATRLGNDWVLTQLYIDAALGIRAIDLDELQRVADEFKDYWLAVPGAKGVKADWLATWRNWVRRAKTTAAVTVKKNLYFDN